MTTRAELEKAVKEKLAGCIGVEREHWTVSRSGRLVIVTPKIFTGSEEWDIENLQSELPAQQIEDITDPCNDPQEILRQLLKNDGRLLALCKRFGFYLNNSPIPPHNDFKVAVFPKERNMRILKKHGEEAIRNGYITGLHIHKGGRDVNDIIDMLNHMRRFIPFMTAISARCVGGYEFASERILNYYMPFQSDLIPPYIQSVEHYIDLRETHGFAPDPQSCWWLMRFNEKTGTFESRLCDMQESAEHCVQLVVLQEALLKLRDYPEIQWSYHLGDGFSSINQDMHDLSCESLHEMLAATARDPKYVHCFADLFKVLLNLYSVDDPAEQFEYVQLLALGLRTGLLSEDDYKLPDAA